MGAGGAGVGVRESISENPSGSEQGLKERNSQERKKVPEKDVLGRGNRKGEGV